MQPTFASLAVLGWSVIKVENGHDQQAVYQELEKAVAMAMANPKQPVAIWTKTIKGYGVKATEDNSSGGHGFPLANGEKIIDFVNEIFGGQAPAEFADWSKALRTDWEKKVRQRRRRPPPLRRLRRR